MNVSRFKPAFLSLAFLLALFAWNPSQAQASAVYCDPNTHSETNYTTTVQIVVGGFDGTVYGTINWQDGNQTSFTNNGGEFSHTYSAAGSYPIEISCYDEITVFGNILVGSSYAQGYTATVPNGPPPSPAPTCSPSSQNVAINGTASLSASGGNGSFSWSAPGGSPASGSGPSFATSYGVDGTKTAI